MKNCIEERKKYEFLCVMHFFNNFFISSVGDASFKSRSSNLVINIINNLLSNSLENAI